MLEAFGGPRERMRLTTADRFGFNDVEALNLIAIEVEASPGAKIIPLSTGLPDDMFEHDGQLTKREIRAVTLSALAPRAGELLWDIGAARAPSPSNGCSSSAFRAIAIEAVLAGRPRRPQRRALGVPRPAVVEGEAQGVLDQLPTPDAIFIGGGGSDAGVARAAIAAPAARTPGGRLVANAVTRHGDGGYAHFACTPSLAAH